MQPSEVLYSRAEAQSMLSFLQLTRKRPKNLSAQGTALGLGGQQSSSALKGYG